MSLKIAARVTKGRHPRLPAVRFPGNLTPARPHPTGGLRCPCSHGFGEERKRPARYDSHLLDVGSG
jgi:hypothetical protein